MAENQASIPGTTGKNQSTTVQSGNFGDCGTLPMAFAGYSMRVMIAVIARRLNVPFWSGKSSSRVIRVLWFMRMAGNGWMSQNDLADLGAGHWSRLRWIIPDGIKDGLIEQMQVGHWVKFRPTEAGKAFLIAADAYVNEEHQRSLEKVKAWKARKSRTDTHRMM